MGNITVFKRTEDSWYPAFQLLNRQAANLVEVSLVELATVDNEPLLDVYNFRVCAWGDDDFGLEKDFITYEEAYECFLQVISSEVVSHELLRNLGFVSA